MGALASTFISVLQNAPVPSIFSSYLNFKYRLLILDNTTKIDLLFLYDNSRNSVLILSTYFVNSIVQVCLSKSKKQCEQNDVHNKNIFIKSGTSKPNSKESQKDGKRKNNFSLFILNECTEISKFTLGF